MRKKYSLATIMVIIDSGKNHKNTKTKISG